MKLFGLLYSQIGYETNTPKRAIIRSTDPDSVPEDTIFEITYPDSEECIYSGAIAYWGTIWKSSWWVIDFTEVNRPGDYILTVKSSGKVLCKSDSITIDKHILWDTTIIPVALDQFEKRIDFAPNGIGWHDCGALTPLRELNSHTTAIIGLCDLHKQGGRWLSKEDMNRLNTQLIQGCDYVSCCQDKAARLGFADGALVHEINNATAVIPGDIAQSVVALAYTSNRLSDSHPQKAQDYLLRAERAFRFLLTDAQPFGPEGFSHLNHGVSENFLVPDDYMTRDLLMMMWGGYMLARSGKPQYKYAALHLAREVLRRQIPKERNTNGLYGHFYTFEGSTVPEKANVHHHVGHDTGATFPHYLVPLIEMSHTWRDHPDAPKWRDAVQKFAYGYFLPACSSNPFYLLPEGVFDDQGLLTFCGPWHGINTSYGFAATLALRLEQFTGDERFRAIATGNMQWIAGLHSGITSECFEGCLRWKEKIPDGQALPYSQIFGIGKRHVGTWLDIPGTIPNGFCTNRQFQLEVKPTVENDGPWLYTDEDWITHAGGWISAVAWSRQIRSFRDWIGD
jgi:hypothetical protein